uniref:Uncharacterized protein n=1 Tax=Pararge aegeria TaxID=116150 RepID=S4PVQ2_9NEOP
MPCGNGRSEYSRHHHSSSRGCLTRRLWRMYWRTDSSILRASSTIYCDQPVCLPSLVIMAIPSLLSLVQQRTVIDDLRYTRIYLV